MWNILIKYIFMRRSPRALKISAVITFFGIALSTAVLIISLSVARGFEESYKKSILDFNAHIILLKDGSEIENYEELTNKLKMFDGVIGVSPFIYRESMAVSKGTVKGVVIKGVDFKRLSSVSNMAIKDFNQRTNTPTHQHTYLGKALAEKLGITSQTTINLLISPDKFQKVEVAGTFESGLYDYDSQFVLMGIDELQKLFSLPDEASGIEVKLVRPEDALIAKEMMEPDLPYPYQISTWQELNRPIFEAVQIEKIMFLIIMGALLMIGIFNIAGALILRIIYKAKDVAILSALGMKNFFIRALFTFHGTVIGVCSLIAGLTAGFGAVTAISRFKLINIEPEIYFLSSLPAKFDLQTAFGVLVAGLMVSALVSYLASAKIAAVNTAEALKS